MPLSAAGCKKAKPKPGQRETVFYDSDGLELAVTRKSKTWRWRYRFAGRRDREVLGCFPTMGLADARKAASKLRMLLWSGVDPRPAAPVLVLPPAPSVRLADVVAQYIQDHTCGGEAAWKPGTVRTYVSGIRMFLAWASKAGIEFTKQLDAKALSRFRPHVVSAPRRSKRRGGGLQDVVDTDTSKSAASVNQTLRSVATMLQVLRVAGQLELTSDAIKDNLKQSSVKQAKPVPLVPAQLRALLASCRKYDDAWEPAIGPFVATMLLTGMRLGEALRLTWADVNFRELTIAVSDETKTGEERRVDLRVSPALVQLLKSMRGRKLERVFPDHTQATVKLARLYLIEHCGAPAFLWSTRFSRTGKKSVPNLRSTCGSYLANAPSIFGAASARRAAEQLGHSIQVAERHYLGALRMIPATATTLEAAMEIEAELERVISA
jgi:integrase